MSDPPGYRQGLISQATALTRAGDANAAGDLVSLHGSYVKTYRQADALPGPTEFFDKFLGALQQGAASGAEGTDTPCVVYTGGQVYYALDAPAAAYAPVGTFVTVVDDITVALDLTANVSRCVGKVCVPVKPGDTWVMFELRSKIMS